MCEVKTCSKCKETKDISNFARSKKRSQGGYYYNSWCNSCRTVARREKSGVLPTPVAKIERDKKECLHCHEMLSLSSFFKAKKGVLGVGSYCKSCFKEKYSNKEKASEYTSKYRTTNPERWRALHRIHQFNRKSLIKATDDGTVTDDVLKKLLNKTHCCWCNQETLVEDRTIEHVIELSNGGLHSASNLDMACKSCNFSRPNRDAK